MKNVVALATISFLGKAIKLSKREEKVGID